MQYGEAASSIDSSWKSTACTLDHDGCVVCSDAGIPLQVVSLEGDDALCQDAVGNQISIAVELVAPVSVGGILLTHGGVAIGRAASTHGVASEREDGHEVRQ
ncbi:MAG: hypothetical protein NVSMB52_15370 [Chloroflexota bacterium]